MCIKQDISAHEGPGLHGMRSKLLVARVRVMGDELESKMAARTEMRMIRWMSGVSSKERQSSNELRRRLDVEAIGDVMGGGGLR